MKIKFSSLKIVLSCYLLFMALFYAPINITLRHIFRKSIMPSLFLEANILMISFVVLILMLFGKKMVVGKANLIDVFMGVFFIYFGPIAFITSYQYYAGTMLTIAAIRSLAIIPCVYFCFRLLVGDSASVQVVLKFIRVLVKMGLIFLIAEFILINFFGYFHVFENWCLEVIPTDRIYDSLLSSDLMKPAGPIIGAQNSGIFSCIAVSVFFIDFSTKKTKPNLFWLFVALMALACSVSITALLVLVIMLGFIAYKSLKVDPADSGYKMVFALGLLSIITTLVFINRQEIIRLRVGESVVYGVPVFDYYLKRFLFDLRLFFNSLVLHPFGRGVLWDHSTPGENYFLRVVSYFGVIFFVLFVLFHGYLFKIFITKCNKQNPYFIAFIYIFVLFLSMVHYASFASSGFSYFYAFCLAAISQMPLTAESEGYSGSSL